MGEVIRQTLLDRVIGYVSPTAGLRRLRARTATEILARHYDAASTGRRTAGWKRSSADANAATGPFLSRLRTAARDLVRNNGYAESAITAICDHVVGWGITAKIDNAAAAAAWKEWAESTACDADGALDLYGLQDLVMRTVVESGECLIRRRIRRPEDGFPVPLQLQVLDPDFIDTTKHGLIRRSPDGVVVSRTVYGIEFDALGRRTAYWLFQEHPGSDIVLGDTLQSRRVPAESVRHVFRRLRPGQVRGPSWFAPVLLRFRDFDDYEDATLMKQKIAACLAVITSDNDGSAAPLGTAQTTTPTRPEIDSLEPGMIVNAGPGREIQVVQPPEVREYSDYVRTTLRAIATGLGVTYEDLTGDYAGMPFSAARMSRLRHWRRVESWRWKMLIPQFCDAAFEWFLQAAEIVGRAGSGVATAQWTAPPPEMIDPASEGRAHMQNIRTGIRTLPEVLREQGYDPDEVLREMAETNRKLDELGLVLDCDPRMTTQAGNPRQQLAAAPPDPGSGKDGADAGKTATGDTNAGDGTDAAAAE